MDEVGEKELCPPGMPGHQDRVAADFRRKDEDEFSNGPIKRGK